MSGPPMSRPMSGDGVSLSYQSKEQELHSAIENNQLHKVQQLLSSGIDINCVLHFKERPEGATVLSLAAFYGLNKIVRYLLENHALVNFKEPGRLTTALHWACRGGDYETIQLLLEHKANVNACNRNNEAPILCAVMCWSVTKEVIGSLIDHGANVRCCDRLRTSPLHYASFSGKSDVSELIIKAGCISNNSTSLGEGTPLANFMKHRDEANCQLLVAAGYQLNNDWRCVLGKQAGISCGKMLRHAFRNPSPLSRICRTALRKHLGGKNLAQKIKLLPLPQRLIQYLLLDIL